MILLLDPKEDNLHMTSRQYLALLVMSNIAWCDGFANLISFNVFTMKLTCLLVLYTPDPWWRTSLL